MISSPFLLKGTNFVQSEYYISKVVFILLPSSAFEASHPGLMRQFERFAIITPTYSTHVHCCMPNEWIFYGLFMCTIAHTYTSIRIFVHM